MIATRESGQVVDVLLFEAKALQQVDDIAETASNGVPAVEGIATKEEIERTFGFEMVTLPIAERHRQLVEVRQQGRGPAVDKERGLESSHRYDSSLREVIVAAGGRLPGSGYLRSSRSQWPRRPVGVASQTSARDLQLVCR